jgi:hypothetical protein
MSERLFAILQPMIKPEHDTTSTKNSDKKKIKSYHHLNGRDTNQTHIETRMPPQRDIKIASGSEIIDNRPMVKASSHNFVQGSLMTVSLIIV